MRRGPLYVMVSLLVPIVWAGCGDGRDPAGPNGGDGGGGGGSFRMSARVDGELVTADPSRITAEGDEPAGFELPGYLYLSGRETGIGARGFRFRITSIPGPGTYPLGTNPLTTIGGQAEFSTPTAVWLTPFSGAAGTITITALTPERVTGTFAFKAVCATCTPAVVEVTDGQFDMPRTASYAAPTADRTASRLGGTLGGQAWNAATIVGTGPGANGTYHFGGASLDYEVALSLGSITAPGTWSLDPDLASPNVRRIHVQAGTEGDACCWGGTGADQGTITVTSVTPSRIVGTFQATLAPLAGTPATAPLTITNGSFEVRPGTFLKP